MPRTRCTAVTGPRHGAVQPDGRVDVSEPASISSGIAQRYATAVFDLAAEAGSLDALEGDIDAFEGALADSPELRDLTTSPVYRRDEAARAIRAVAARMGLSKPVAGALGLMASKRRLFTLPQMLERLRVMVAAHKGEVAVDVASAKALSDAQRASLVDTLKARIGKDIKLKLTVDDTLIGGLVIKVGSQMIDTSIRAQLEALKNSMKEVG